MTGSLSQTRGRTPRLHMTMDEYGRALRAAYVEGYVQGSMHPNGESVIPKGQELAWLFWRIVEDRVYGPRSLSPADDGGAR